MIEEVKLAAEAALARIDAATTADAVRALEAELLGKRGPFATFKTGLGALATVDEKRAAGQAVNAATSAVSDRLAQRRREHRRRHPGRPVSHRTHAAVKSGHLCESLRRYP